MGADAVRRLCRVGTVHAMTDASGTVVWRAHYTPFGHPCNLRLRALACAKARGAWVGAWSVVRWTTTRPTPAGKARQSWVSEVRALAGTDRARLSRGAFPTLLSSPCWPGGSPRERCRGAGKLGRGSLIRATPPKTPSRFCTCVPWYCVPAGVAWGSALTTLPRATHRPYWGMATLEI